MTKLVPGKLYRLNKAVSFCRPTCSILSFAAAESNVSKLSVIRLRDGAIMIYLWDKVIDIGGLGKTIACSHFLYDDIIVWDTLSTDPSDYYHPDKLFTLVSP